MSITVSAPPSTGVSGTLVANTYREIHVAQGILGLGGASTWLLGTANTSGQMFASGTDNYPTSGSEGPYVFRFKAADYAVTGLTTKLRVVGAVSVNATAPTTNFTFGLYPVTVAGAANLLRFTVGTVVSGSTVAVNAPSASTITTGDSTDFTIPSDGVYMIAVASSGTSAANSIQGFSAQLQARNV